MREEAEWRRQTELQREKAVGAAFAVLASVKGVARAPPPL